MDRIIGWFAMKRKVLFLDVDGVLNHHRCMCKGIDIDPECVLLLNEVLKRVPEVDIVISSVWRANGVEKMSFLLESTGLNQGKRIEHNDSDNMRDWVFHDRIIGTTGKYQSPRGLEIQEWLDAHPEVERFVILDDDSDMLDEQLPFFVQTSTDTGLLPHHVDDIVKILEG